jgi:hypothetical protein
MHLGRPWLALLVVLLAGCQGSSTPPRQAASSPAATDVGDQAAEALTAGDHARAAELYRKAVQQAPERVVFHYGLGVATAYLDQRPEAVRELQWVLAHGNPGSAEVREAYRWLRSVGALPASDGVATESEPETPKDRKPTTATVHGRVTFGESPGDTRPMERMVLFFFDHPNRVVYYRIRTDEQGRFRFAKVPPGVYTLTDRVAGTPRWRLRVEVKAGQDLALDLTPSNTTKVRDDFPGSS